MIKREALREYVKNYGVMDNFMIFITSRCEIETHLGKWHRAYSKYKRGIPFKELDLDLGERIRFKEMVRQFNNHVKLKGVLHA